MDKTEILKTVQAAYPWVADLSDEVVRTIQDLGAETAGEMVCISDDIANGDDPEDGLAEYRFWRSPAGRAAEQ